MSRPLKAEISRAALRHNLQCARQRAPGARLLAVVKADAYGHGAIEVARTLEAEVEAFGVAAIEEAIQLREAGIRAPILLLEGCFSASEWPLLEHYRLWAVLHGDDQLRDLEAFVLKSRYRPQLWLKVDTGMHRLGFSPTRARVVAERLVRIEQLPVPVVMGHFACADHPDHPLNQRQISALPDLQLPCSLANSAAIFAGLCPDTQWLRLGIGLYGGKPLDQAQPGCGLIPAMRLSTAVIALRTIARGESVGYGASFVALRESRIATLAVGYADGYPRQMKPGTPVLLRRREVPLVGRVSMDMITVDVTDLLDVQIGDQAILFGPELAADRIAACADTIDYTLFAGLTARVPKVYL